MSPFRGTEIRYRPPGMRKAGPTPSFHSVYNGRPRVRSGSRLFELPLVFTPGGSFLKSPVPRTVDLASRNLNKYGISAARWSSLTDMLSRGYVGRKMLWASHARLRTLVQVAGLVPREWRAEHTWNRAGWSQQYRPVGTVINTYLSHRESISGMCMVKHFLP